MGIVEWCSILLFGILGSVFFYALLWISLYFVGVDLSKQKLWKPGGWIIPGTERADIATCSITPSLFVLHSYSTSKVHLLVEYSTIYLHYHSMSSVD